MNNAQKRKHNTFEKHWFALTWQMSGFVFYRSRCIAKLGTCNGESLFGAKLPKRKEAQFSKWKLGKETELTKPWLSWRSYNVKIALISDKIVYQTLYGNHSTVHRVTLLRRPLEEFFLLLQR